MKNNLTLLWVLTFFVACDQSRSNQVNSTPGSQQPSAQPTPNAQNSVENSSSGPNNDIVGEWSQQYAVMDQNSNGKLDPEERNGTRSNMGFNWFKFNSDGTCQYDSDMKFKGNYTVIEENGKRQLNVTVNGFGETYKHTIADPVTQELILYSTGAFMIFKKN